VAVLSNDRTKVYNVTVVDPTDPEDAICECKGYDFRGHCSHQAIAIQRLCRWVEGQGPDQSNEQRKDKVCPRCGDQTEWIDDV
jgi:hypothetical protein